MTVQEAVLVYFHVSHFRLFGVKSPYAYLSTKLNEV